MRKVWAFILSDWIHVVRSPSALLTLLGLPVIFTLILSGIFGGSGNAPLRIGLVEGSPDLTAEVARALRNEKGVEVYALSLAEAEGRLRRMRLDAYVVVPGADRIGDGLQVILDPATGRGYRAHTRVMKAQAAVNGRRAVQRLAAEVRLTEPDIMRATARYDQVDAPAIQVDRAWQEKASGAVQVSPGMLVMFILMFAAHSGEGIVLDRIHGTLRRLLATPVTGWQYLTGRILAKISMGMFQFAVLSALGSYVLQVNWSSERIPLLVTALIFTGACAAFGFWLGMVCRTPEQLSAAATVSCLAMAALGGTWWPMDIAPEGMQVVGQFLPTGLAMRAFQSLIVYGAQGRADAQAAWLGLAAWGVFFLVFGAALFQSQRGVRVAKA